MTGNRQVMQTNLMSIMGTKTDTKSYNSRMLVMMILVKWKRKTMEATTWASSWEMALFVSSKLDAIERPTIGDTKMSNVFIILEVESFNFKIITTKWTLSYSLVVMFLTINSLLVMYFVTLNNYLIVSWVSCNINQYMVHLRKLIMIMMLRYQLMV